MTQEITPFEQNLNLQMRYAEAMAAADMLPDKFKNKPANVLVAQDLAKAMGESVWVIMSELYFVGNVPTFSAKFMRSRVRDAGHILRESFDPNTMTATCTIIRKDDPGYEHVVTWDMAKARAHGLGDRGHWKKNPELMLKNRAVSENVRGACNEVMGGVHYTPDEAEHMETVQMAANREELRNRALSAPVAPAAEPQQHAPQTAPQESETPLERIAAANTGDELKEIMDELQGDATSEQWVEFEQAANNRLAEIQGGQ